MPSQEGDSATHGSPSRSVDTASGGARSITDLTSYHLIVQRASRGSIGALSADGPVPCTRYVTTKAAAEVTKECFLEALLDCDQRWQASKQGDKQTAGERRSSRAAAAATLRKEEKQKRAERTRKRTQYAQSG